MAGVIPNKQVKLEWFKTDKNVTGDNRETVYKRVSVWASVKRIGGGRTTGQGQTVLKNSIEFTVYFRPDLYPTGNWRVVYDGRKHTVQSIVKKDEGRMFWVILADSEGKR